MTTTTDGRRAREAVAAAAARLLAARGTEAVPDVLAVAAEALGCSHLSLRATACAGSSGPGGDSRPPRPDGGRWVLDVPVRAAGEPLGVLTATAATPFSTWRADALLALADVLALALSAGPRATHVAGRAGLDDEADRAQVAAVLHETVGRALVTVRYTAEQVAAGRADPAALDDPVRAALTAYRQAQRDLRAHALDAGLRAALRELAARGEGDRPDDGWRPVEVSVHADDPALDEVAPAVAVTVQRVAEAALRGAKGRALVVAVTQGATVKLTVECADNAYDAGELVRWARRASALGGAMWHRPGGVELTLPVAARTEGRHDDSPHL